MILHVGITGSREGMSNKQVRELHMWFEFFRIHNKHVCLEHGDCIGVDETAHKIALHFDFLITIHPPLDDKLRAFCFKNYPGPNVSQCLNTKPYLERNRDIVNESHILIAVPNSTYEKLRSGTWSTVRYARGLIPVVIIYP